VVNPDYIFNSLGIKMVELIDRPNDSEERGGDQVWCLLWCEMRWVGEHIEGRERRGLRSSGSWRESNVAMGRGGDVKFQVFVGSAVPEKE
jgi:hypothetical protein